MVGEVAAEEGNCSTDEPRRGENAARDPIDSLRLFVMEDDRA